MAAPFTFLDRVDAWVGGPGAVLDALRSMVLPGGDRPVTRAGDASRIPEADVRARVVDVALGIIQERVREGLTAALAEHLAAVREEFEMMEGERPDAMAAEALTEWQDGLRDRVQKTFVGSECPRLAVYDTTYGDADVMAAHALDVPVADPTAVLERAGVRSADVDALVAQIRKPPVDVVAEFDKQLPESLKDVKVVSVTYDARRQGWSVDWLGTYLSRAGIDPALAQEGVAYVLTDPDMVATGAELLGLADDKAFASWAHGRLVVASDEENAAAVAQVLRAAGLTEEGGDVPETGPNPIRSTTPETAADGEGGKPPAAQAWRAAATPMPSAESLPSLEPLDEIPLRVVRDADGKASHLEGVVPAKPAPAEESDLTRAVSAALAALFDHGCESDKAMAAALGVERSVVAGARKRTAPWAPTDQQVAQLQDLMWKHMKPINDAFAGLKKT